MQRRVRQKRNEWNKSRKNRRRAVIALSLLLVLCFFWIFRLIVSDRADTAAMLSKRNELIQMDSEIQVDVSLAEAEQNAVSTKPVEQSWFDKIYAQNHDFIGWLNIENTKVDYPVLQHPGDEEYYLTRGFDQNNNSNGSLFLDNDSVIGAGTAGNYSITPTTNLIIHGHNRKTGEMFGELTNYSEQAYADAHPQITLRTQYETRTYQVIAAFTSKVYMESNTDVFKYYEFFQADTKEAYDAFIQNISERSLIQPGVQAEYGDELLTLSTCVYQVESSRFVVVAKRVS